MPAIKKNKVSKPAAEVKGSLAAFLERPLPDSDEVSRFEEAIDKEAHSSDVEDNLSAIYNDGNGQMVDVTKLKKRKSFKLLNFFKRLLVITILACGIYGAYYYYFQRPVGTDGISVSIVAPEKALAGEAISYRLQYKNESDLLLADVKLEAILPAGFMLKDSVPVANGVNSWSLGNLADGEQGEVVVNGYLIAPVDSANIITARLSYTPENFSSGFKKEATANTVISGLGFGVTVDYLNTALLGQNNEFKINLSGFKANLLNEFYLDISASDNIKIEKVGTETETDNKKVKAEEKATSTEQAVLPAKIESSGEGVWLVSNLAADSEDRFVVPVSFKLKEKKVDNEDLRIRLFKKKADGTDLVFWEKTISFEVVKSDLNLNLTLNGEKTDQPLDYASTLNYSLEYTNNGDSTLNDLVLMAVIKGDAIQWSSLRDPSGGSLTGNAIVWTKENIRALAEVSPGSSGKIEFSVKLKDFAVSSLSQDASLISYAQYGLNNNQNSQGEDNKSNTIKSLLNSDLSLSEKILYFNEDNVPVGAGPLPPRVNEKTSVRVYWTLKNNLHDLQETETVMELPQGVEWAGGENTNVGSVSYNEAERKITWRLGYLPTSVYRADAEFAISITPSEADKNKILVLSSGSTVKAVDNSTKAELIRKTQAKTTKLEDDEIAGLSNNGRVE